MVMPADALLLAKSHTLSVPSSDTETALYPSTVTATALTQFVCALKVCSSAPLDRSHTLRRSGATSLPGRVKRRATADGGC